MIYFINEYLLSWNSGIEHSEVKRLKMFKDANINAKLITRNYDPLLSLYRKTNGLNSDQILNMFDYFQNVVDVKPVGPNLPKIDILNLPSDYIIDPGADVSKVYNGDEQVMSVYFAPGTYGQLYKIDYYDSFGKTIQSTFWDFRGFKSRDQFFGTNGELISQLTYDLKGNVVVKEYFSSNDQNQSYITLIELMNYHQEHRFFNDYDELFTFFLDEVARNDNNAIMVADRPGSVYDSLLNMNSSNVKRFVTIPTVHTIDMRDPVYANLSGIYNNVIVENINNLNGVIVATERQKNDLTLWEGGVERLTSPIYVASFAVVLNKQLNKKHVSLKKRIKHKIIVVTRLLPERYTNDIIEAFAKIINHFSDATLDIYGYGEQYDSLKAQIEEKNLVNNVKLKNYVQNLDEAYDESELYINTTGGDSQPLAIIEALSHGLPTIAYDAFYGPQEAISQGKNGYLIRVGDINGIARAIELIFNDDLRWEKMSEYAYKSAKKYSEDNVLIQWKKALGLNNNSKK